MRWLAAVVFLLAIPGVVAAQDTAAAKPKPPKKDPSVIALWEIEEQGGNLHDAFEIVQNLRPRFLQVRSRAAAGGNPIWGEGPGVLVNDAPRGGANSLRSILASSIREIRFISGPDAASRYGVEYHAGAILVLTK